MTQFLIQRRDEWIYSTLCRLLDSEKPLATADLPSPSAPVFRRMLTIARIHGVLVLILEKMRPLASVYPSVWNIAVRAWQAQIVQSARVRRHAEQTIAVFERARISFAMIKGPDFADNAYPQPRLRPPFDMDLLIPRSSWDDAIQLLEENGHVEKQHQAPMNYPAGLLGERTWAFLGASGIEADLHWNLIGLPSLRKKASVEFEQLNWLASTEEASRRIPTAASRFLIACLHALYGHQFEKLILFSDLLQTARYMQRQNQCEQVREMAARTHTRIPVDIALAVAARFTHQPVLEEMRQRLAAPLEGEPPIPEIPEPLFDDATATLHSIRNQLKSPCRLRIRQWLRDVC